MKQQERMWLICHFAQEKEDKRCRRQTSVSPSIQSRGSFLAIRPRGLPRTAVPVRWAVHGEARDPARGWQPASERGSAWEGSRLPRPACACPVLGWVSPPPETPSASAEDARGEKKAWHCIALRCSTLVAFHYSASHHLPSPRVTSHHTVACLASLFLLLCSTSRLRAPGAVPTWKRFFPRCFDRYVLPELPCRWK